MNNIEKLMEEIAKPPSVLPHLTSSASTASVESNNASVKPEAGTSVPQAKSAVSVESTQPGLSQVQIKIEEPQDTGTPGAEAFDHATPPAKGDNATETPLSGKRSREASGMAVDESDQAEEQTKKQKVTTA